MKALARRTLRVLLRALHTSMGYEEMRTFSPLMVSMF